MKKKLLKLLNTYSNSKLEFQRWKSQIIIQYILNLIFYFLLKSRQEIAREHPVFDNILILKKILKDIKSNVCLEKKKKKEKLFNREDFKTLKSQNLEKNLENTSLKKKKKTFMKMILKKM